MHGRRLALFTKLNIRWGYNNIRIQDGDQWKAAFKTNRGLFKPMVMFFSLTNAPTTFQSMMNFLFCDLINEGYVTIYMDNILIHTPNDVALHRRVINDVLRILAENDLYLKPQKCQFEATEVKYLGVVISKDRIAMDPVCYGLGTFYVSGTILSLIVYASPFTFKSHSLVSCALASHNSTRSL